jgi:hypothetical protein
MALNGTHSTVKIRPREHNSSLKGERDTNKRIRNSRGDNIVAGSGNSKNGHKLGGLTRRSGYSGDTTFKRSDSLFEYILLNVKELTKRHAECATSRR